ncbi:MAG: hypothetical protein ACRDOJ_01690, partial [Nocardioidaceae bacterium]
MRRSMIAASALPLVLVAAAGPGAGAREDPGAPPSTYVGTADIEERESVGTASDGDLWPSCWADDGNLYTANGDGKGFSLDGPFSDIAVNRVEGEPPNLSGETLARGDEVGTIWSGDG